MVRDAASAHSELAGRMDPSNPVLHFIHNVGSAIGVVLLALAGVIGTDTGLAAMSSLRPTLGVRGASVPAVLNAIQLVGWGAFEVLDAAGAAAPVAKSAPIGYG